MDTSWIEILVLAVVALIVLGRLYQVLGRRTGSERPSQPAPAQGQLPRTRAGEPAPAPAPAAAAAGDGFSEIARADPSFDNARFLAGARSAYELIVDAYAKGDRDQLKPLLTPRVYEAYAAAIAERQAKGEAGPELVRLRAAELSDATLENNIARVSVQFEAELAEGLHHMRETRERWTFERDVRSQDPNWRLARVVQA